MPLKKRLARWQMWQRKLAVKQYRAQTSSTRILFQGAPYGRKPLACVVHMICIHTRKIDFQGAPAGIKKNS